MSTNGRRQCLRNLSVLLGGAGLGAHRVALSHHGFLGKHDFARPMFLRGRVVQVNASMPHVRMQVDVPRGGGRVPRDREWMRPLEDAEARATMTIIKPFDQTGRVALTFDWRLSRALIDDPSLLAAGDDFEAVVYRRTANDEYHDELLVVLLRTENDEILVSSRPIRRN